MFLTLLEVFDILVTIALMGFLFMDAFNAPRNEKSDELSRYLKKTSRFNWHDFLYASMVTAPAIVLHELGHKITALSFGYQATFHAFYANQTTLILGVAAIVMKFLKFGFIFLVPGFVSITGIGGPLQSSLISFAGPGVNLLLYLLALIILRTQKLKPKAISF